MRTRAESRRENRNRKRVQYNHKGKTLNWTKGDLEAHHLLEIQKKKIEKLKGAQELEKLKKGKAEKKKEDKAEEEFVGTHVTELHKKWSEDPEYTSEYNKWVVEPKKQIRMLPG